MPRPALALVALAMLAAPAVAAERLTAGFAARDVTPALMPGKPVYIAGFGHNRVATKVHDPLSARAVVLGDGVKKVAVISVDVIGLFHETVEAIRAKLPGFDAVLVSSTHNHDGPDMLGLWGRSPFSSGVDPVYLAKLVEDCVQATRDADAARQPANAVIGTAHDASLIVDNRQPEVKHDELVALRFDHADTGKPLGVVVQWNCHPETLGSKNTELSGDFVGPAVERVAAHCRCPCVYLTGTVGGLLTSLKVPVKSVAGAELADGTHAKAARYGELVGDLAIRALAKPAPVTLTPFTLRAKTLLVPVDNPLYRLAWQAGVLKRTLYEYPGPAGKFAETSDAQKSVALKTEVGYWRLGDLEVALIPGEIYPELVLDKVVTKAVAGADYPDAPIEPALYPLMKKPHRMLVGLANDELGYIIPKRQWDAAPPFAYGLNKPQYGEQNSVGPEAARIICEAFRVLVTP